MRLPSQIFPKIILQHRGKRTRLLLTLQNVVMFLFLGNGVWDVSPVIWMEDNKWNADIIHLQLRIIRWSQWTLEWYEDSIEFNGCEKFTYVRNTN